MFTGLIEEIGTIRSIERGEQSARFTVHADRILDGVALGDSITVNGACLTVVHQAGGEVAFDAVYETPPEDRIGCSCHRR